MPLLNGNLAATRGGYLKKIINNTFLQRAIFGFL